MFIKQRLYIYALYIYSQKSPRAKSTREVLYFRTSADATHYQKSHYKHTDSEVKELDAIEEHGEIRHFHYNPSAAKHGFGPYILDDNLRMALLQQDEWVLVGLNRPHPNKRIAGSPTSYKEVRHFIWVGKVRNELVIKDAKILNKPIVFANQRSLNSFT